MLRSAGVAILAILTALVVGFAALSSGLATAATALIMSGTFTPTPPPAFVDMARDHFIVPTHPGQPIGPYIPVTTPEQAWPVTGLLDYPFGTSVRIGEQNLQAAMAQYGGDGLVIFGHSQSSVIAYREKTRLAEQYPVGTPAPDIQFVTIGTLNLPNGGVMTRFWGAYLPFVDFYFNGPAPTDTQFHTDIITQRWDGFADFPIYPINGLSVLNAVAGIFYVHEEYEDVTLAGDPSQYFRGSHGDTDYYFFDTENLPLFGPLRSIGVPEALIDVVEPLTTFAVELGYRRDIPLWQPTPARLIPLQNPVQVAADFVAAVVKTIDNTRAVLAPTPPVPPAPPAAPVVPVVAAVAEQAVAEPEEAKPERRLVIPSMSRNTGPRSAELLSRGHEAVERDDAPDVVEQDVVEDAAVEDDPVATPDTSSVTQPENGESVGATAGDSPAGAGGDAE